MDRTALEEIEAQLSESGRPIARIEVDQLRVAAMSGDVEACASIVDDILAIARSEAPQVLAEVRPLLSSIVDAAKAGKASAVYGDIESLKKELVADVPPFTMENIETTIEVRMAERVNIFRRGLVKDFRQSKAKCQRLSKSSTKALSLLRNGRN